jgi:hypothetical protein
MKGIRDQKDLNDFVARMAKGRASAKAARGNSTAPPAPKTPSKARQDLNAVPAASTKVPAPAKKRGVTAPTAAVGPGPGGGHTITIRIGK